MTFESLSGAVWRVMHRRGFTLIEVLLVLALLAVLAGVVWPAVLRFTGEQALKDGSETVRRELDATRIHAVETGLTYQFRFEPGGNRFVAVPVDREMLFTQASTGGTLGATPDATTATGGAGVASKLWVTQGKLREDLMFRYQGAVQPMPERISEEMLVGLPDARTLAEAGWSPPILFRPDGTAGAAVFRLQDPKGRFIELTVRELTGMASTGPLRQEVGR